MKIKISELEGPALDWAVAKCEGFSESQINVKTGVPYGIAGPLRYSTDWSQGGPIIYREGVSTHTNDYRDGSGNYNGWVAHINRKPLGARIASTAMGETPLIAAMRCYCTSKLGDTVDIPKELL